MRASFVAKFDLTPYNYPAIIRVASNENLRETPSESAVREPQTPEFLSLQELLAARLVAGHFL